MSEDGSAQSSQTSYELMGDATSWKPRNLRNILAAFFFIAIGDLLFGYIMGINSNMVTDGQILCVADTLAEVGTWTSVGYNQCWDLDSWGVGLVSSLNLIGAVISSAFCFYYADAMGRRREMLASACLYGLGALAAAVSPSLVFLCVGLFLYGLGIGFAMHASPVYIAELAPPDLRGMLVSAIEAVVVSGMLLGFVIGFAFGGIDGCGWRFMISLPVGFSVVMGVGIASLPCSPKWLVLKAVRASAGEKDACMAKGRASLSFFKCWVSDAEVDTELETMHSESLATVSLRQPKCMEIFRYPLPLIIGCGLMFLQQMSGQPTVIYYSTNIFKAAGFHIQDGSNNAALASVVVGSTKLLATLFTVWRVDKYGRCVMLYIGIGFMAAALLILSFAFYHQECSVPRISMTECPEDSLILVGGWKHATILALGVYLSGYEIGFGPISWLMVSEVFPLDIRGAAISVASIVNFTTNIVMTSSQASLMVSLTDSGIFALYFFVCALSLLFVRTIVPETRGLSLAEVERLVTLK